MWLIVQAGKAGSLFRGGGGEREMCQEVGLSLSQEPPGAVYKVAEG